MNTHLDPANGQGRMAPLLDLIRQPFQSKLRRGGALAPSAPRAAREAAARETRLPDGLYLK